MALRVKTAIDGSGFAHGLAKMEADAAHFGKGLSGKIGSNMSQAVMGVVPGLTTAIAGIFAADNIKQALSDFVEQGKNIKFGAIRMNVDEETFQRVDRVMNAVGETTDTTANAFDKLADSMTKIDRGDAAAGQLRLALAELGVTTKDLESKDYQQIFFKIADGMKGITPSKEQVAALRQVFGRGGDNLLPAFEVGFNSEFAKAGLISDRDLHVIKDYERELSAAKTDTAGIWNNMKAMAVAAGTGLLGGLNPFQWARRMGTPETTAYDDTFWERQRKKVEAIDLLKRKNDSLEEGRKKDAERADKDDRAKEAVINKETAALKERNRFAAMTPEKQRLELLQQIKSMQGELKFGGGDLSRSDEAAMRKHIEELRGQIAEIDRSAAKPHHALSSLGNQAIGGIMLGHDRSAEMNGHLRRAADHLSRIDAKIPAQRPGRAPHPDYH